MQQHDDRRSHIKTSDDEENKNIWNPIWHLIAVLLTFDNY
jgi:hypothetical protein